MKYGEAIALVAEIAVHDGSHLGSALAGMTRPMAFRDIRAQQLTESYINVHRDEKAYPDPIRFPLPWPDNTAEPDVSPEERERLRAVLVKRSAFGDR